jgi:hypothetical protein
MDNTSTLILLVVIVALVIAVIAAWAIAQGRSRRLRARFGPEYARLVQDAGGRRAAEAELAEREKRVNRFSIRPLSGADRDRYRTAWRQIQALFVDNPRDAVTRAEALLSDVMAVRGYPEGDFEQRAADLSVHHPVLVQSYRSAHEVVDPRGDSAGTEGLRQAMVHYRALFDELIDDGSATWTEPKDSTTQAGTATA